MILILYNGSKFTCCNIDTPYGPLSLPKDSHSIEKSKGKLKGEGPPKQMRIMWTGG